MSKAFIYDLRINDLYAPMGIDRPCPSFSWKMQSSVIGAGQRAYWIAVTDEQGETVWNTGWVESNRSVGIRYDGYALQSATAYHVSVKIKDQNGEELSPAQSTFETGFLGDDPLAPAQWITIDENAIPREGNLPAYRRAFSLRGPIAKARLYTTGLGVYESYINGVRVGRLLEDGKICYEELKPGYTQMEDRKFYSTYDVTAMLTSNAENVLSAVVTSGWWNGNVVQYMMPDHLIFRENAYMAKLVITYRDGQCEEINTDGRWTACRASAVQEGTGIWEGEVYHAGVDQSWMLPGYDASRWTPVKINKEFTGKICAWNGVPVTVRDDLEHAPKKITVYQGAVGANADGYGKINVINTWDALDSEGVTIRPGQTLLVDFGQNFAGWEYLQLKTLPGTKISVLHGEMINDNNGRFSRKNDGPEGSLYRFNYNKNTGTVGRTIYYASGCKQGECYHPSFTFYGFRYIELTADQEVTFYKITGQVVTSAHRDTGHLITSDRDVNRLIANARWGMYSNYLSVPTDCPQRDERQAWTADTQNFAETGCYLNDSKSFLEKYMVDIRDAQDPRTGSVPGVAPTGYKYGARWGVVGWADAIVLIPWFLYLMYGDTAVIEENWDAMTLYMDTYMANTNGMGGNYGTLNSPEGPSVEAYGDWLSPEDSSQAVSDRLSVAYYAWDARIMATLARAIGKKPAEIEKYEALYQAEKALFQRNYVKADGTLDKDVQSVCLHALYLDLLPDDASVAAVTRQLVENIQRKGNKLGTGFLGTEIIMHTLTKIGRTDLAYRLLLQHAYPSWLYSVDQGATTIWERWNAYTVEDGFYGPAPHNNSFNHYSYGSVVAWMFRGMAGISYDEDLPGFQHFLLKPRPDQALPKVEAAYESIYGKIISHMHYEENAWHYDAVIPANTSASIFLPVQNMDSLSINRQKGYQNVEGLTFAGYDEKNKIAIFHGVAGAYSFQSTIH